MLLNADSTFSPAFLHPEKENPKMVRIKNAKTNFSLIFFPPAFNVYKKSELSSDCVKVKGGKYIYK
jgi:hypothetical protein